MITLFQWFVKLTAWIPQKLVFRTKVYYENKAVQSRRIQGKAIVVSNHTSIMDYAVILFLFPTRTLRALAAEVLYQNGCFMRFFLRALGMIRVDRNTNDFSFIDKSCRVLDRGGIVEIFPESRLPREGEERPLPFKPSAVYVALETDAPIIPIYTTGKLFCKERNRVIIGTPINPRELFDDNLSMSENIQAVTQQLRGKIIELQSKLTEKVEAEREFPV